MLTEEAIKRCKELIKPVHSNWIGLTNQKAIEMILDIIENVRLKEELKKSKYVYGIDMDFDYIPKQKIRDKIQELEDEYEDFTQNSDFIIADIIQPKIKTLKELLEEEFKNEKSL